MAGKNEYGKKKKGKTTKPKSPIDDFDSDLGDGIQLSLPIKKARAKDIDAFHSSTSFNGNVNDNA